VAQGDQGIGKGQLYFTVFFLCQASNECGYGLVDVMFCQQPGGLRPLRGLRSLEPFHQRGCIGIFRFLGCSRLLRGHGGSSAHGMAVKGGDEHG